MNTWNPETIEHIKQCAPGLALRKERQKQNLSIADIAERTCLRPKVIEALEADDYQDITALTYVYGYIKMYAKVLGTDPECLLEHEYIHEPISDDISEQSVPNSDPEAKKTKIVIFLCVVVFVAVMFFSIKLFLNQ